MKFAYKNYAGHHPRMAARICACGKTCAPDRSLCNACRHRGETPKAERPRRRDRERDREPYKGRHCHVCEGMPWRRPLEGRCKFGGRFAEDPEIVAMRPRFWVNGEAA